MDAKRTERTTEERSCALLDGREAADQQRHRRSSATVGRAETCPACEGQGRHPVGPKHMGDYARCLRCGGTGRRAETL